MWSYLLLAVLVAVCTLSSAWDVGTNGISCGDLCVTKSGKCNFEASAFVNTPAKLDVFATNLGWNVGRLALAKSSLPANNARHSACQSPSAANGVVVCCCNFDAGCPFEGVHIGVRCNGSSWEFKAPTATSARQCKPVTKCQKSEYVAADPTRTSDRVCLPLGSTVRPTTTYPSPTCQDYQYEKSPPTATSRRVCMPIRVCNSTVEFENKPPTLTSNRGCNFLRTCATGVEYESRAPTLTSNRGCTLIKACDPATEYELTPPTATSQRVCRPNP